MINKLKSDSLNCNIFSVYDYDGLTVTELLCQFFTKINECIASSNKSLTFLEWLKEIGLPEETRKLLNELIENGTIENLINNELFSSLNDKINGVEVKADNKANKNDVVETWQITNNSTFTQLKHDYVIGIENLYHLHTQLGQQLATNIVFSGDSTFTDYGLVSPNEFTPYKIFKYMCDEKGFPNAITTNKAYSGLCTEHWNKNYISELIALNPNAIILRWGINDPSYDKNLNKLNDDGLNYEIRRNAQDFEKSLDEGLTKLRTFKDVSNLSIILMSPNNTSDDSSFRNESWHESINSVIRKLARKHKCVFIDTYRYLQDVRNAPHMDMVNGGHIHPKDMMNVWINELLVLTIFKDTFVSKYTLFNKWNDLTLKNNWTHLQKCQYKWLDKNTIELRGLMNGGLSTTLAEICDLPITKGSRLSIKTVSTEVGVGTLNVEGNIVKVGNLYNITTNNWVSIDNVRIYLD